MLSIDNFFTLQNLKDSWARIKSKSGSKIDIPFDETSLDDYLLEILDALQNGNYVPDPVKQYVRVRDDTGKEQKISILTVRDKIVQQALVNLLNPLFEPEFLDCSYAYRQGRSALDAANKVQEYIQRGNIWVLETDIASFFDSLDHSILIKRIQKKIVDPRIIELLTSYLTSPQFCEMSFYSVEEGISIGGIISPLLSNIYLHPLDLDMVQGNYQYLRYSDDLIVLGTEKEEMKQALFLVKTSLKKLRLDINKSKTAIRHASEGFVFLGFRFDEKGRGPAVKAIETLNRNISTVISKDSELESRLAELEILLQGWSNYYGPLTWLMPREYSTLIALVRLAISDNNNIWAEKLLKHKKNVSNGSAELSCFLAREWLKLGWEAEALFELGKALAHDRDNETARTEMASILKVRGKQLDQIADQLTILAQEPLYAAGYHALSEIYLEAGLFKQAQVAHSLGAELESKMVEVIVKEEANINAGAVEKVTLTPKGIELFLELFDGRDEIYSFEVAGKNKQRLFTNKKGAITADEVERHLAGEVTLNIYLMRGNQTVKLMVIDIDISKKIILEKGDHSEEFADLLKTTQTDANRIKSVAEELGINTYIEDSGYRGRHCWFFFEDPIKAGEARALAKMIMRRVGAPSGGVTWELIPGTDRLKNNQLSHCIKLPFGRHPKSGFLGLFVDETGFCFQNQGEYLQNIRRISTALVEKTVAVENKRRDNLDFGQNASTILLQKDSPLTNEAGAVLVKPVVAKCALVRFLILKAEDTQYLTHQDRLSLLHVLAHLGEEGTEYLHKVMACCLNYNWHITQKHIDRLPGKPISCNRLREKYQELTAALRCNCRFKLLPKNYPSPVLHAAKQGKEKLMKLPLVEENSFIPLSGNNASQAEEILQKMQNLRKQQQGIENSLKKNEQQLQALFDRLETDRLVIESGTLVRRRVKDKIKWIIEI